MERNYDEEIHKRVNYVLCVKRLACRRNVQKLRSESIEDVRKTTGFFTNNWRIDKALESYFEQHARSLG